MYITKVISLLLITSLLSACTTEMLTSFSAALSQSSTSRTDSGFDKTYKEMMSKFDKDIDRLRSLPENYVSNGTFIVNSSTIEINVYEPDETKVDGDRVLLKLNGKNLEESTAITATKSNWKIKGLMEGKNWLGVEALSYGASGNAVNPRIEIFDGYRTQSVVILASKDKPAGITIHFEY